ncbi:MAG: hypothetical protein J6K89_03545, partial [Oscillospiraceae bacterium]|nr:hypothetical protein [Oscillospiraceae bacterium]
MNLKLCLKRSLCFLLLLSMLVGFLPAQAQAAEERAATPTEAASSTLEAKAAELLNKINNLPEGGDWNGQLYLPEESGYHLNGLRGSYYLARKDSTNKFYILDGRGNVTNGTANAVGPVTMMYPTIAITGGVTPDMAVTLVPRGQNGYSTFSILMKGKDKVLYLDMDTIDTNTPQVNVEVQNRSANTPSLWISHDCSDKWALRIRHGIAGKTPKEHCLAFHEEGKYFYWTNEHTEPDTNVLRDNYQTKVFLYRIWSTKELRATMDRVKGYLQTPTSYPQDQYETFLSTVESAITTFEKRNGFPQKEADTPRFGDHHQEELDRLNMELLSYVTLFDSKEEYIDIPIEILDFRADNVLFQSTAYYGLRFDKRDFVVGTERYNLYKDLLNLPGQLWPTPPALLTADAASYVREGLTKPALVNGNLVYEEGTIDYVAHALTKIPIAATYDTLVPGWNDSFRTLQNSEGFILGSWADTQKKIVDETGRITGRNGDHLPYSSV